MTTFCVAMWVNSASKMWEEEEGELPYVDRVDDLVKIMWGLFAVHLVQFLMQNPLLKPNDRELSEVSTSMVKLIDMANDANKVQVKSESVEKKNINDR